MAKIADLYLGRSTLFKSFLLLGVAVISLVFIWYTFSVIDQLKKDTRQQVELYVRLWQEVANTDFESNQMQVIFDEVILKASFPIIVCDVDREPISWRNITDVKPDDTDKVVIAKIKEVSRKMRAANGEIPLYVGDQIISYFYYGDSEVIHQLIVMPFIEIGIVIAFLIVGMIGFQNIRRSEERYIWVGMAKETAHQLGTPISSLMGWLELIKKQHRAELNQTELEELLDDTSENMQIDVTRLQQVANRFGLIGSIPDLIDIDLNVLVQDAVVYFRRRLPFQGKGTQIDFNPGQLPSVCANAELFGWALENLIKNALQAVDSSTGKIILTTSDAEDSKHAKLTIEDNGKGISATAVRKIFKPGFTTKKRGWGMGLTLVKRIIEEYHDGQIILKHSRPGSTMFQILLPLDKGRTK